MRFASAFAATLLALLASSGADACTLSPLNMIFLTEPAVFEAEVVRVRRVYPMDWERSLGPIHEAEFKLTGPVPARNVPRYRWAENDDCGPSYEVKRGQRVLLLLESDIAEARRQYAEIMESARLEMPSRAEGDPGYQEDLQVLPYTNDLSKIREILERYRR
ncbi:hypothetical protein [Brevundimonas vesicularis]|uniref:hypothetical protein n=1 Tax=Brevundimonas vesicularis TaxID=41276 RepID=UPI0022AC316C|nr:hypothetical protein [Brevundimonas vesicularis]